MGWLIPSIYILTGRVAFPRTVTDPLAAAVPTSLGVPRTGIRIILANSLDISDPNMFPPSTSVLTIMLRLYSLVRT